MRNEPVSEGLGAVAWPVRTERLEIRQVTKADGPATWHYRRHESVTLWITSAPSDRELYLADFTGHSWRLMERVGMRRESHFVRGSLHRSGEWLDKLAYALLADEWHNARPDRWSGPTGN